MPTFSDKAYADPVQRAAEGAPSEELVCEARMGGKWRTTHGIHFTSDRLSRVTFSNFWQSEAACWILLVHMLLA